MSSSSLMMMASSSSSSGRSLENLPPQTVARIARELKDLHKNPPPGFRIIPSCSLSEITAELEGPTGTPYESYLYTLKLVIASDFPITPPRGYFLTKIYHPNISTAGEICVNTLKRDWTSDTALRHVLTVIRCLLIVPFPESSLNDEAGKLFMESYAEYAKRAKLMADIHGRPRSSSSFWDPTNADGVIDQTSTTKNGKSKSSKTEFNDDHHGPASSSSSSSSSPLSKSSLPQHGSSVVDERVVVKKSAPDNPLRSSNNTTHIQAKKKSLKRL